MGAGSLCDPGSGDCRVARVLQPSKVLRLVLAVAGVSLDMLAYLLIAYAYAYAKALRAFRDMQHVPSSTKETISTSCTNVLPAPAVTRPVVSARHAYATCLREQRKHYLSILHKSKRLNAKHTRTGQTGGLRATSHMP